MVKRQLIPVPIVWLTLCLSGLIAVFWAFDLTINFSSSMPIGLWRISKGAAMGEALRHKAVLFCPPDTDVFRWARTQGILSPGRCPGGYTPLLKEVVGLPGDEVQIKDSLVFLNGHKLAMSHSLPIESLSASIMKIPEGFVWVMGTSSPESFDSRYFGSIPTSKILGSVQPVLVSR